MSRKAHQRKKLPAELSKDVAMLTCESATRGGICDVYLIGTRHYSPESCEKAKAVIQFLKPQAVFMELDPAQGYLLTTCEEAFERSEFLMAYAEAMKYGAKVIFGDRPKEITLRRIPVMDFFWDCFISLCIGPSDNINGKVKKINRKSDADTSNQFVEWMGGIFLLSIKPLFVSAISICQPNY